MIIKSMSRKNHSFGQLFDYIGRKPEDDQALIWNLNVVDPFDRDQIVKRFRSNAGNLRTRRGGNVMFHEVVSLKDIGILPIDQLRHALRDLALEYLSERAPDLLAYGRIHEEAGHLHYHLMISANQIGESNRFRLSKFQFGNIQRHCEQFLGRHYPQLLNTPVYGSERKGRTNAAERRLMQQTGQSTVRDAIRVALEQVIADQMTNSAPSLTDALSTQGFEFYERGKKSHGVVWTENGKKYRFRTLGLLDQLNEARDRESAIATAKEQIQTSRLRTQRSRTIDEDFDFLFFS